MKNKAAIILGVLQAFTAIGAIPAGFSMISQSDGSGLGMSVAMLAKSPFPDFFIPGLFLFSINGLLSLVGAVLSFIKNKYAGLLGLGLGVFLAAWIIIQLASITLNSFLQPLLFFVAYVEIWASLVLIREKK
jgi:hypothetical protein